MLGEGGGGDSIDAHLVSPGLHLPRKGVTKRQPGEGGRLPDEGAALILSASFANKIN